MFQNSLVTHFFFLLLLNLGALNVHLGFVVGCHETEREALLKFKHNLIYDDHRLSSWEGKDCCNWYGVGCDNVTFNINRLDLHNPLNEGPMCFSEFPFLIARELDPSLIELRHLTYLDLSCNDFLGSHIPEFIGSFKHLRYLNLSYSTFSGVLPSQLGNLTRLQSFDLYYYYSSSLSSDLLWVTSLVSLQYLSLGEILVPQAEDSMHALAKLPSLRGLRLSRCGLSIPMLVTLFSNSTWLSTIQQLDLSGNSLEGTLPYALTNLTSLTHLDISFTQLNGSIPSWLRNMRKLEHLKLSNNNFSSVEGGTVIGIIGNLCKLKLFDLSRNYGMGGELGVRGNFSECITHDLETLQLSSCMIGGTLPNWLSEFKNIRHLDISYNRFDAHIPASIGSLTYLEELVCSGNNFTGTLLNYLKDLRRLRVLNVRNNRISGQIPTSFGNLLSLNDLDLSYNLLNGIIPEGFGKCKNLVRIDLSSNFLGGVVSEFHLANLSRLDYLDLSFNPLNLNLSPNWSPPFQLSEFHMSSCKITPEFPQWIRTQKLKLKRLDLSNNMMSGKLGNYFPSTTLTEINVSHNNLTGSIPPFFSTSLSIVDLSYNLFTGPLLHTKSEERVGNSFCNISSLYILNLQKNNLTGFIPDCWVNISSLNALDLSYNQFYGNIPMSLGQISLLRLLNLNNNALEGNIPLTLSTCNNLIVMDISENNILGKIPSWGADIFPSLISLKLRANQLEGVIPPELCSLASLQFMDLADNKLIGNIPRCLGNITGMRQNNHAPYVTLDAITYADGVLDNERVKVVLKGEVLEYSRTLGLVHNLDLSSNNLTGSVPIELTNLTALIGLNLSHNHLTGNIPKQIGKMVLLESLDLSNNYLTSTIPSSISALTSMVRLNLSYNKLHGQIPSGHQLQVIEDPSLAYIGNPGLCGDPLPNKCGASHTENQPTRVQEVIHKEDNWDKLLLYFVTFSGFATGFWGVVGSLLLKKRFRWAVFLFLGNIADYIYVQVMIRFNRLRN